MGDDTNDVFYDEINDLYATAPKENHFSNKQYTYPVNGVDYYCLTEGKCYTFKITDTYGDGLSAGQGGSYVGSLDDDVAFQGDGQFDYEDVRKFCVGGGNNNPEPSKAPTMKPSKAPTNKPTTSPTNKPTNAPTNKPTDAPVDSPTTSSPTQSPTVSPTSSPTSAPTISSTASPTNQP